MNKNILIVLVGAIVVAVLVAVIVQVSMGGKPEPVAVEEVKLEVLLAAKDLKIGDKLKAGDVRWQSWPKTALFSGAVVRKDNENADKVFEGRLARDVNKDEPFTKILLIGETEGNFVAASLEAGMRAVAIEVSAATMVGGFIEPGDYVDVILTYNQRIKTGDDEVAKSVVDRNLDKVATETVVQNVRILAVDQRATRPEEGKVSVGKTVTLELSLQDAERIALAQEIGVLTLSLRGVGDDKFVEKYWPTISDLRLTNVDDEIFAEYQKTKTDSGLRPHVMKIYSGGTVQTLSSQ